MKTETMNLKVPIRALTVLLGLGVMPINQYANALSAEEICSLPNFILWKKQQENRLWTPTRETLSEERSGKLFIYNCFTFEEIDQFFISHENRIENAHFYPILEPNRNDEEEDDDACE